MVKWWWLLVVAFLTTILICAVMGALHAKARYREIREIQDAIRGYKWESVGDPRLKDPGQK